MFSTTKWGEAFKKFFQVVPENGRGRGFWKRACGYTANFGRPCWNRPSFSTGPAWGTGCRTTSWSGSWTTPTFSTGKAERAPYPPNRGFLEGRLWRGTGPVPDPLARRLGSPFKEKDRPSQGELQVPSLSWHETRGSRPPTPSDPVLIRFEMKEKLLKESNRSRRVVA